MASSPFEVEDQTDEDFFDKLVRDDDDDDIALNNLARSSSVSTSNIEANDFDEAKAFSSLSVSELVSAGVVDSTGGPELKLEAEQGGQNGASLGIKDEDEVSKESQLVVTTSNLVYHVNVNESGEVGTGEEAALDKNNVDSAKAVKVVQWSSFSSDWDIHGESGFGSGTYSDPFNELGNDSEDPFANLGNVGKDFNSIGGVPGNAVADLGSSSHRKNQDDEQYVSGAEQNAVEQDLSTSQQWENMYPGWRYDAYNGQWHQVDGYNATATTKAEVAGVLDANSQSVSDVTVSEPRLDASYHLEQTAQSVVGNVADGYTNDTVSNWNQSPQVNMGYPAHIVFDPQYPGWYYDTIVMEWKSLQSYNPAVNQSISAEYKQQYQIKTIENHGSHGKGNQDQVSSWGESMGNHNQQDVDALPAHLAAENAAAVFAGSHQLEDQYGPTSFHSADQDAGFKSSTSAASYEMTGQGFSGNYVVPGFQSSDTDGQFLNHQNQIRVEPTRHLSFSSPYFASQKSDSFMQQPLENGTQFYHTTSEGRSPAGRPPHALVTFGFGGKLIVIKNINSFHTHSTHNTEEPLVGVIHVLNLIEVVIDKANALSYGLGDHDYFYTLCQQSFPGPLVGGSVSSKELIKWIDDQIGNFESPYGNYRSGEVVRLLFSLLKIACHHYGKLRSPFITDPGLKESDCPESAVANLFASAKSNSVQPSGYGTLSLCLQNSPSQAQMQATALEVQKLLLSGKKKEALECARQGQLWGLAVAVASQLGDQFHGDILKQMALKQLVAGSPLQTLCLLISGNPAEVFSSVAASSNLLASQNLYQQPAQIGGNSMLDQWEENLAIITANRIKGDELVIIHLGDCLWKERGEIIAAHICYLVAETNFEPYSESARLCLIGADHWKCPRTYASPEAIQRTELYEYAKVLGNSQFLLLPFQPYKLIYAYMLAEVGKVDDSLKYCHAILKSLKTSRVEMDTCRQLVSSLEERLRTHQQGGYGNNLAPTKLVGKLFTLFDSTAQRVVGGLPPTTSLTSSNSIQHNENAYQSGDPKISASQSTMATPSLMPSVSVEPISEWAGLNNQPTVPNRSISEPDFGKTPEKVNLSKEATQASSTKIQEKAPAPGRFGRFVQRTVGLVLRSRPDRQAKLGEMNKFYYDEKLKRWVEEGAEPPTEETTIPPPPTTAPFQSWMPDQNVKGLHETESFNTSNGPEYRSPDSSDRSSGIPPMPPSSNQFSARGRMGVRGRYVDTFKKGGGTSLTLFQSPPALATKPGVGASNKFFIPTPVASGDDTVQKTEESTDQNVVTNVNPPTSFREESLLSTPASPMTLQRFSSMDNIVQKKEVVAEDGSNSLPEHSRRAASWSGNLSDSSSPTTNEIKHSGDALGLSQSCDMLGDP